MSTMLDTVSAGPAETADRPREGRLWPLAGIAAAPLVVAGLHATMPDVPEATLAKGTDAIYAALSDKTTTLWVGASASFLAVLAAFVFFTGLVRLVSARADNRAASAATALNIAVSTTLGAAIVGAFLKAILVGGLEGHGDHVMYTKTQVEVLEIVVGQGQWAAWWGLVLVMGAVAVLGIRHRVLPRWLGIVSAIMATFCLLMTTVLDLPYSSGLVAPAWFLVAGIGTAIATRKRV